MTTTCTHDCGCTREAEPSKADCYRCWSASKRGTSCQPTTEQRILTLLVDSERAGVDWLRQVQIASALGFESDSAILAGTLARMVASGAIGAYVGPWLGEPVTRYCTVAEAEKEMARRARVRTPLRTRTPLDTIAGKATLEARVGVDRAGDIISGGVR